MNDRPRTRLANPVNDVMAEAPSDGYLQTMAAVTPRKLWLAQPGDCVVLLAPPSAALREHVERVTGVDAASVDVVAPEVPTPIHACDLVEDLGARDRVADTGVVEPFVLDDRCVEFARTTGVSLYPYAEPPDRDTLDAVRRINTKRGFREIAAALGLRVAPGGSAATSEELARGLTDFLRDGGDAIVKVSRSSNGHGTFVVHTESETTKTTETAAEQVSRVLGESPSPGCGWVYERFQSFTSAPSVELLVGEEGAEEFYTCWQRIRNNAWTGMTTPADPAAPHVLAEAAGRVGAWLHAAGYRGYFDVDFGIEAGVEFATEANVRRTGGTYLEELVRRLHGGRHLPWRASSSQGSNSLGFAEAVRRLDRAGLTNPAEPAHVLLTADTREADGLWRYLAIGESDKDAEQIESELAHVLGLR